MHVEPPTIQHLPELPPSVTELDAGLLQPGVVARIARHLPDLADLTLMVDDPAALDGPPLTGVRRLRLVRAADLPALWPRLVETFPGVDAVDLVNPERLAAADLAPLAAHGVRGLGLFDVPDAAAAPALAAWPALRALRLAGGPLDPWLAILGDTGVVDLAVRAGGEPAVAAVLAADRPLDRLHLHGAADLTDAAALAKLGLEALILEDARALRGGLGALRGLRTLELEGCPLPGPALAEVARLRTLRRLRIERCAGFDGATLAVIAGLPDLVELDLSGAAGLRPHDLAALGATRALRRLALRGVRVEGGLAYLRALPLVRLDLRGCAGLRAGDFAELGAMQTLERLDLDLLAWKVDRHAREALLGAHRDALAHYRYSARELPDGAVEERVVDVERPWDAKTRVQGAER